MFCLNVTLVFSDVVIEWLEAVVRADDDTNARYSRLYTCRTSTGLVTHNRSSRRYYLACPTSEKYSLVRLPSGVNGPCQGLVKTHNILVWGTSSTIKL